RRRGRAPGHPLVVGRVRLLPDLHAGQPLQRVLDGGRGEVAAQALDRGPARHGRAALRGAVPQVSLEEVRTDLRCARGVVERATSHETRATDLPAMTDEKKPETPAAAAPP